jgi:hypothetical protein
MNKQGTYRVVKEGEDSYLEVTNTVKIKMCPEKHFGIMYTNGVKQIAVMRIQGGVKFKGDNELRELLDEYGKAYMLEQFGITNFSPAFRNGKWDGFDAESYEEVKE